MPFLLLQLHRKLQVSFHTFISVLVSLQLVSVAVLGNWPTQRRILPSVGRTVCIPSAWYSIWPTGVAQWMPVNWQDRRRSLLVSRVSFECCTKSSCCICRPMLWGPRGSPPFGVELLGFSLPPGPRCKLQDFECVYVCVISVTRSNRCLELRSRWGQDDASGLGYLKRKVTGPVYSGVTPTSLLRRVTVYTENVDGESCTKVLNSFNHESLFFRKHVSLRIVLLRLLYQTASNP